MAPSSLPNMDCTVKLRAPPGFQVAVNFMVMDMLEGTDGGCTEDFVNLFEDVEKNTITTFGLLGE